MRAVLVLPTYEEGANIEDFLRAVRDAADVDVLVVDDNSPDGTGRLAEALGEELGGIRVVHRPGKAGLGSAYREGFDRVLAEDYDVVLSMDADFSHDPAALPDFLVAIESGADAVIGSRYVPGGSVVNWPPHRRWLSRWGNSYTRAVLHISPHDCTSGYRAYRADTLKAIDPASTDAEGYAFLTELARRMTRQGARIHEVPITFRDREQGKSKMSGRIVIESMLLVTRWGIADGIAALGAWR
jgi:dolichol-phosphate mannosyltransferase